MYRNRAWLVFASLFVAIVATSDPLPQDDFKVDGWKLTIASLNQTVEIEPPALAEAALDGELKDGEPGWRGPLLLPGPAWAYGALRAETITATLADAPDTRLEAGRDFALDPAWAAVAVLPGSAYAAGTKVHFAYSYGLSRIDLIEQTPDGNVVVVKGVTDKTQPHLPDGTRGNTPLAGVYLPNHARALTPAMINVIDRDYDGVPPVLRPERLTAVKHKLETGEPVTLVFLGDSITAQQPKDFRDGKGSFVERFKAYLRKAYPRSALAETKLAATLPPSINQTIVVMSGVGGNDTPRALRRLETDVLAHKPDLVIVMFGVNDENRKGDGNVVPVAEYKSNLTTLVEKVRSSGGEPLLMTPSMKNMDWSGTVGNLAAYAQAMRDVASVQNVCLVDNYRAWEMLPQRGYNYMAFLGNCINHPIDLGHDLFFRGLREALEETPPAACACPADAPCERVGAIQTRQGAEFQNCVTEIGKLHSPAMQRDIDVAVLLPPAYATEPERRFPILYALHGMGAPFMTWAEMSPLREALAEKPMILVVFNGDKAGWYLDATQRPRSLFTTFFFKELAPWADRTYRTDPARLGVTGFSMGANGAMHYMLTQPDFFASASGLSSRFTYFGEDGKPPSFKVDRLLGSCADNRAVYDAVSVRARIATAARTGAKLPPLFIGCGTDDKSVEGCRVFRDFLTESGFAPEYAEAPGAHNWPYWKNTSPSVIDFHWRTFQPVYEPRNQAAAAATATP